MAFLYSLTASETSVTSSLNDLRTYIDDLTFSKLEDALSLKKSDYTIQKHPDDFCELGHLFDISKDKQANQQLKLSQCDRPASKPIGKVDIKPVGKHYNSVHFIYESCRETLNDNDSSHRTILDTIYAHYISSKTKGYCAEIDIISSKKKQNDLKPIFKSIKGEKSSKKVSIPDNLFYKIGGKLPLSHMNSSEKPLRLDDLQKIEQFGKEQFYEKLDDEFILSVLIKPLNPEIYFSPIIEKLISLNKNTPISTSYKVVIDSLTINVVNKVIETAFLIKSGVNYLQHNLFLHHLCRSDFLNDVEWMKLFQEFQKMTKKSKRFSFNISIGPKKSLNKESSTQDFQTEAITRVMKTIQNLFQENSLKLNLTELCQIFQNKQRSSLLIEKHTLEKNENESPTFKHSSSVSESSSSEESMELSADISDSQKSESLPKPENIEVNEISLDSLKLLWTMPNSVNNEPCHFRIELQKDVNEISQMSPKIQTEGNRKFAYLKELSAGTYKFRIKAIHEAGSATGIWTNPISISSENNSGLQKLQPLITAEEHQELHSNLNNFTCPSVLNPVDECCELGWLYDIFENKQVCKRLPFDNDQRDVTNGTNKVQTDRHENSITFTYVVTKEVLSSSDCSNGKSILETPYVHYIKTVEYGFLVKIHFTIEEGQPHHLTQVINFILQDFPTPTSALPNGIQYSVSGKIPAKYQIDEKNLQIEDVMNIKKISLPS